jgi:hypothetical protein
MEAKMNYVTVFLTKLVLILPVHDISTIGLFFHDISTTG